MRHPSRRPRSYRAAYRLPLANSNRRIQVVVVLMAMVLSFFGGRLLLLQVFDPSSYADLASDRMLRKLTLYPVRGTITDRNGTVLAASEPGVTITADPLHTTANANAIAAVLMRYLGGSQADYLPALTKPKSRFAYVAKQVPASTYDAITAELSKAEIATGIFRESTPLRLYPARTLAAQILGSVGADGAGVTGFEYQLNPSLAGANGMEVFEAAPDNARIPLGTQVLEPAVNGNSYQLTLDSSLQWFTEQRLQAQVAKFRAQGGMAVVMDVKTGQVVAAASATTGYDANRVGVATNEQIKNQVISQIYEPGSVQKVLTFAALLDAGKVDPDSKFTVPGRLRSGGGLLRDAFAHGTIRLNSRGILVKSSNIGTVLAARTMPAADLRNYLLKFGLGAKTGVQLPGEESGQLPPADMPPYSHDQIAFGQGLSVTALQLTAALAAIANGGSYNQPTIIASGTGPDGLPLALPKAEPRQVISPTAAKQVVEMMEGLITPEGRSSRLRIDGYRVGGKSGTGQVINPKCGCYKGAGWTLSFTNVAPVEAPRFVTYVALYRANVPSGTIATSDITKEITQFALRRFGIAPSMSKMPPNQPLTW